MESLIESEHSNSVTLINHPLHGKVIRKENVSQEEAVITKELSEQFPEFIVKYYGYEEDNLYIEYVPSISIQNTDHMLIVMGSLINAIRSLHQAGYLHRDICEDNLAITDDGIKLYDFGSVCKIEDCNLDILGHYYRDDYEEKAGNLEGKELEKIIRKNDYYALAETLLKLNKDNFLPMTTELQNWIDILTIQ